MRESRSQSDREAQPQSVEPTAGQEQQQQEASITRKRTPRLPPPSDRITRSQTRNAAVTERVVAAINQAPQYRKAEASSSTAPSSSSSRDSQKRKKHTEGESSDTASDTERLNIRGKSLKRAKPEIAEASSSVVATTSGRRTTSRISSSSRRSTAPMASTTNRRTTSSSRTRMSRRSSNNSSSRTAESASIVEASTSANTSDAVQQSLRNESEQVTENTPVTTSASFADNVITEVSIDAQVHASNRTTTVETLGDQQLADEVTDESSSEAHNLENLNAGDVGNDDQGDDDDQNDDDEENDDGHVDDLDDDDGDEHIRSRAAGLFGISQLRTGYSGQSQELLNRLREQTTELVTLEQLSSMFSMAQSEDQITNTLNVDAFVREMVSILRRDVIEQPAPVKLSALAVCRCLAALVDLLQSSADRVINNGAVQALCACLIIDGSGTIDLPELAINALLKISTVRKSCTPTIVRENGLQALPLIAFMNPATAREYVQLLANCSENFPVDQFSVVRDCIIPNIPEFLDYQEPRTVELACLSLSRLVESFRNHKEELEAIASDLVIRKLIKILNPSNTGTISVTTNVHLWRMFNMLAHESPKLATKLLRDDTSIVNRLYEALTGSPPGSANAPLRVPKNQNQLREILGVVTELLPPLPTTGVFDMTIPKEEQEIAETSTQSADDNQAEQQPANVEASDGGQEPVDDPMEVDHEDDEISEDDEDDEDDIPEEGLSHDEPNTSAAISSNSAEETPARDPAEVHLELLATETENVRQFGQLFVPALINVYNATVNSLVRLRIVTALLKMVYYIEEKALESILPNVNFADFLSGIFLDPQDLSLVIKALQLAELLMEKMPHIYEKQFFREGVSHEIAKLAELPIEPAQLSGSTNRTSSETSQVNQARDTRRALIPRLLNNDHGLNQRDMRVWIVMHSKTFRDTFFKDCKDYSGTLDELKGFAAALKGNKDDPTSLAVLRKIAQMLADSKESFSAFELLNSGLMEALLDYLTSPDDGGCAPLNDRQRTFLHIFLNGMDPKKAKKGLAILLDPDFQHGRAPVCVIPHASNDSQGIPAAFPTLIKLLHGALNREERYDVTTAHQSMTFDQSRNPTVASLNKHLKLRLVNMDTGESKKVSMSPLVPLKAIEQWLMYRIETQSNSGQASSSSVGDATGADLEAQPNANNSGNAAGDTVNNNGDRALASNRAVTAQELDDLLENALASPSSGDHHSDEEGEHEEETGINEESRTHVMDVDDDDEDDDDDDGAPRSIEDTPFSDDMEFNYDRTNEELDHGEGEDDNAAPEDAVPMPLVTLSSSVRPQLPVSTSSSQDRNRSPNQSEWQRPADWHLEFYIDGSRVSRNLRVYAALHRHKLKSLGEFRFWETTHELKYKKAEGPAPAEADEPESLPSDELTTKILNLLRALYNLNASWEDVHADDELSQVKIERRPASEFLNHKLTAKMNRQMEEPLIVACKVFPSWSINLARNYRFLFPFETRHMFLQSTSFGFSRLWSRWQSPHHGRDRREEYGSRLRIKARIQRANMLQAAFEVMRRFGTIDSVLEVEYFDEIGSGLGPTLEFYSTISKELCKRPLKMWRDDGGTDEHINSPFGLYPAPLSPEQAKTENGKKIVNLFKLLGQFVAKAMVDSRIIDIPFNPVFLKLVLAEPVPHSIRTIKQIDEQWAKALASLQADKGRGAESLELQFVLLGTDNFELKPGGADLEVTSHNVQEYIDLVISCIVGEGVSRQVAAFREGFRRVFPVKNLSMFNSGELSAMFGKIDEDWSKETLRGALKADHGFNMESRSVKHLIEILSEFDKDERRLFLQFITGSSRLPIGGFKRLNPSLTVVHKPSEPPRTPDCYLPSVMTCQNYLKMPDYSSKMVMREKLSYAMREGQGSFHLS